MRYRSASCQPINDPGYNVQDEFQKGMADFNKYLDGPKMWCDPLLVLILTLYQTRGTHGTCANDDWIVLGFDILVLPDCVVLVAKDAA